MRRCMQNRQWSLQDAKNKFSEVINAANAGTPQIVTRRGVPAAVVLSMENFSTYQKISKIEIPSFTQHLLNMPTDNEEIERLHTAPRDFL